MKKNLLLALMLLTTSIYAQEHFSGINTSRRTGILNASINPAELTNLKTDYEVNVFTFSANIANNKITFGDLVEGENFEELIFSGDEPANMRADVEILGPSFAMKHNKWAFGISSGAKIKATLIDIDVNLGDALTDAGTNAILGSSTINTDYNQRATATTWGEIGFSAAREIYTMDDHRFTGGITLKLLFPGSYANVSADRFSGTITNNLGDVNLTDASAGVNLAYSGSLAEGFTDSSNFSGFFAGGLNGFAADFGVNYQWKNPDKEGYKINVGLAFKNMGSMTFNDDNNVNRNYTLEVEEGESLDLNQFEGVDDLREVEQILLQNPQYFTAEDAEKDFKVKLPAVFSLYADVNVYNNWYVTGYTQQKLNEDSNNDQIAVQNIVTITPRYSTSFFEVYSPLSHNEISGFTAGVGFRVGGFFIGSGSVLSAMISDTNQADAYLGFRIGF